MRRRKRRRENGIEIPVTPLIDIVFLLLIYFLLASHFVKQQTLRVKLPESTVRGAAVKEEVLTVTITKEGRFLVNGKEVAQKELGQAVKEEAARTHARRAHLEADREASVQLLVTAMDAVREAGLKEVMVKTLGVSP